MAKKKGWRNKPPRKKRIAKGPRHWPPDTKAWEIKKYFEGKYDPYKERENG